MASVFQPWTCCTNVVGCALSFNLELKQTKREFATLNKLTILKTIIKNYNPSFCYFLRFNDISSKHGNNPYLKTLLKSSKTNT